MFRYFLPCVFAFFVLTAPTVALAQDSNGNYYQGYLPFEGDYVISMWRVTTPSGLNCRSQAGTEFKLIKQLAQGTEFNVSTSEGRHQHNNPVELDELGLPWFRLAANSGGCRVRANSRYIAPRRTPS